MEEHIYIVLSRSHTFFAKAIRIFTKKYYNHTSVSFEKSLDSFYSFGRRYPRLMFPSGFITEGVKRGFFALYPKTKICVIDIPLKPDEMEKVRKRLAPFLKNPRYYKYNIKKIPLMMKGIPARDNRKYVCSAFVAYILQDVLDFGKDYSLVYPEDFLSFGFKVIYEGEAQNYDK